MVHGIGSTLLDIKVPQTLKQPHYILKIVRMITTHPILNGAKVVTFKSIESMPRIKNRRILGTIAKHYGNISFHGGMADKIPQFLTTTDDKMHGIATTTTYHNKNVPIIEEGYLVYVGKQRIFAILVGNGLLHNLVYIKLIVTK
jgi:hypothetical protein